MTHPSPHRSLLRSCAALAGALVASVAVVAPAVADDAPASVAAPGVALNVRVTGGADPAIIAAAIAAELGVPTEIAADGAACTAPCVAVEIGADARAAIAVVLAGGTYQRAGVRAPAWVIAPPIWVPRTSSTTTLAAPDTLKATIRRRAPTTRSIATPPRQPRPSTS